MNDAFLPQLSIDVEMIHSHFQSYYEALDLAAFEDVAQLLYPDWRNSLEKPFLWLGDFHPYLFINLLRLFIDDGDENEEPKQIECGLRLMVQPLVAQAKDAQMDFLFGIEDRELEIIYLFGFSLSSSDFLGKKTGKNAGNERKVAQENQIDSIRWVSEAARSSSLISVGLRRNIAEEDETELFDRASFRWLSQSPSTPFP